MLGDVPPGPLRRGWTTGACATAATRAAYEALLTGVSPASVEITLPNGARPSFAIATFERSGEAATAGVVKDAGDDPDVTHGALIQATVAFGSPGTGVVFRAGLGVGTVTKPGLPLAPGEPAINPVPRDMMRTTIREAAERFGASGDVVITISVPNGAVLAEKTLNARLGIIGGISILGTTGIVVPYSCAAWIHSIHRGIDVARATGLTHVAGSTGNTSEAAVQRLYGLSEGALIDMGDFVGGMLKYLKRNPVARVTIAGGFAKMTKLGQGLLDLHSKRGAVDREWLADLLVRYGAPVALSAAAREANTAQLVLDDARRAAVPLGDLVAAEAWRTAAAALGEADIALDVVIFDRAGALAGRTEVRPVHSPLPR
ncbi:cobalt-precorrin-5B (C(1))-methyltransferase [Hyphomicrobium sp.]|uniref:cobalt-precorrin-5B (C(1))-methyltransferase n=1 Tax=Hyphomicrobium sp. TaxID=82 RepID=UPI002E34A851|nr:cobalt-precorrin-5B (C(1))-methyltransferase [Hyphomicrobium sp.]HEX2841029.1 cobalt-precorrin-5B (C(1))-methyltransferase [Hyphomicrobium sp.]